VIRSRRLQAVRSPTLPGGVRMSRRSDRMGLEGAAVAPPVRETVRLWAILALVGGIAWVVTLGQATTMGAGPGTMGMAFLVFVWMWVAMMAAMMLPAIGPLAAGQTLQLGSATTGRRIAATVAFGAGFLLPWAAYGALAFGALQGTGRLVDGSPEVARSLGVAILAVAGLYQFTPWKLRALRHCRMPAPFGSSAGPGASVRAGGVEGAICVGCCWALMTVLIAMGVTNVGAMAGLAVVIFAEKVLPRPRLVAGLAGVALVAMALLAAFHPSLLSGLIPADMPAGTGGMEMGDMGIGGM
jgi:predicted metal-binding membrane protein